MRSAAGVEGDRGSAEATDAGIAARLRREIISRRARIGVIGQGYVGLPLSVAFGDAGFDVLGFDVDPGVVAAINAGRSHIPDVSAASIEQLVADGFFRATQEMAELSEVDVIIICVPTPLSKTRDPNISYVIAAADQVARALRPGQLVILESTTYPGTAGDDLPPQARDDPGIRRWCRTPIASDDCSRSHPVLLVGRAPAAPPLSTGVRVDE